MFIKIPSIGSFSFKKITFCVSLLVFNGFAQDGVWVEAESISPAAPWKLQTTATDFWGSGYFYCDITKDVGGGGSGLLSYEVNIPKTGSYEVAIRGRRHNLGICLKADQCNDIFIKVGTGGTWTKKMVKMNTEDLTDSTKWGGRWNEWVYDATWGDVKPTERPNLNLQAGKITFQISARSMMVHLDGFAFYIKGTIPPIAPGASSIERAPNFAISQSIEKVDVFDINGAHIKSLSKVSLSEIESQLKNGLYILKTFQNGKVQKRQLKLIAK